MPLAALFVLGAALTTATGNMPEAAAPQEPRSRLVAALAELDVTDLSGRRWTLEGLRGRVVLIDFWATWCAPCLAELPRLQLLRQQHGAETFEVLGISLDAISRRSFVSWINRHRIDWPQVHERAGYRGRLAQGFGVDRLPRNILLARDGSIAAVDVRGERLNALVAQLTQLQTQAGSR